MKTSLGSRLLPRSCLIFPGVVGFVFPFLPPFFSGFVAAASFFSRFPFSRVGRLGLPARLRLRCLCCRVKWRACVLGGFWVLRVGGRLGVVAALGGAGFGGCPVGVAVGISGFECSGGFLPWAAMVASAVQLGGDAWSTDMSSAPFSQRVDS